MSQFVLDIHTGDSDLAELCELYWEQDDAGTYVYKTKELAEYFDIPDRSVAQTVAEHSTAYLGDDRCAECQRPHIVSSRSDLASRRGIRRYGWTCSACRSQQRAREAQAAREKDALQRELILEAYGDVEERRPVSIPDLDLLEAVALLGLVRVGATEDFEAVTSRDSWEEKLSPTVDLDIELLRQLFHAGAIRVDPRSPPDAFDWETGQPASFFLTSVAWLAPGPQHTRPLMRLARELEEIFRTGSWPQHWVEGIDDAWNRVALHECLAYLVARMDEHSLNFKVGDKTRLVIGESLATFTIGQVYNFIWRAARDAAAYYMRSEVPRAQAANSVVGRIQRTAERSIAEGWDVNSYGRDWNLPESSISAVLMRSALQMAEPLAERPRLPSHLAT